MVRRPYLKLRRLIEDEGLDLQDLAHQANMGYSTLSKRLCTPEAAGEWRWKEIVAICKAVGIPQEKIGEYFFPAIAKEGKTA
nr:MAG TPA: Cro/C1-type HTH DNA-binding domain protein [Caudoviricetes sp.]